MRGRELLLVALALGAAACSLALDLSDLGGAAADGDASDRPNADGGVGGGTGSGPGGGGAPDATSSGGEGVDAAPPDGAARCRENPIDLMNPFGMVLAGATYRGGLLELAGPEGAPTGGRTAGASFGRLAAQFAAEFDYEAVLPNGESFELAFFWSDRPFDPQGRPQPGRPPACGQPGGAVLFRQADRRTVQLVDLADCGRVFKALSYGDAPLAGRHTVRVTLGPFFGVEATIVSLDGNGEGGNGPPTRALPVHFGFSAISNGGRITVSGARVALPLEPSCPGGGR